MVPWGRWLGDYVFLPASTLYLEIDMPEKLWFAVGEEGYCEMGGETWFETREEAEAALERSR